MCPITIQPHASFEVARTGRSSIQCRYSPMSITVPASWLSPGYQPLAVVVMRWSGVLRSIVEMIKVDDGSDSHIPWS